MAPGLLPGDVVTTGLFPLRDRLTAPRRFDRWVLAAADGTPVIKRIVGLPGESLAIVDGDLVIDGRTLLKSPRLLAALGSRVSSAPSPAAAAGDDWQWVKPADDVLDDAPQAAGSLLLLPVRDVGSAAVVSVQRRASGAPVRLRARVGETIVTWPLRDPGRYAVVAGRLDGHLVAAAWRVPHDREGGGPEPSCLPDMPPARWTAAIPWDAKDLGEAAPAVAIGLLPAAAAAAAGAAIDQAWRWRDALHRPAPDGTAAWQLPADTIFVLGDFPLGSRDSRHWGPLPVAGLRWRLRGPDGG